MLAIECVSISVEKIWNPSGKIWNFDKLTKRMPRAQLKWKQDFKALQRKQNLRTLVKKIMLFF